MLRNFVKKINKKYLIRKKGIVGYVRYCGVKVGADCRIYTSTFFGTEPFLIEIGNKVTITEGVKILTHDGATWLVNDENGRRYLYKKVVIGNNVFIGVNTIILPGVKVEDNVIIAAGSVVTKSIPTNAIVAGNPAKIIGDFHEYKEKVLNNFVSDAELNNRKDYRQRVLECLDAEQKKYIKK